MPPFFLLHHTVFATSFSVNLMKEASQTWYRTHPIYKLFGSKVLSVILWLMNSLGTKFFHHNNMFLKILLEFFWSVVAEIAAAYDKNTSPPWFLFAFAQLKRNRTNCDQSWETFESYFPLLISHILSSYLAPDNGLGTGYSFLEKWCFIILLFTASSHLVPSNSPSGRLALSLLSWGRLCYQATLFIDWETITSFWRWFLVLPQMVFVLLNPCSRHMGITGELVKRCIEGHHLGILNHCICDWHPTELHLTKSCLLIGKSSSLGTDSRDPWGAWWESFYRHSSSWFMLFFYSFFLYLFTYLLVYS